jgi:hypothetical protein
MQSVQVGMNNVAQTTSGHRRRDHVRTEELLRRAGFPSLKGLVTMAVAMEAWKAFYSSNGGNGSRNPIGKLIFNS